MLDIQNKTPFNTILIPSLDKLGRNFAVVIINGTFNIHHVAPVIVIAEEQQPAPPADVFYGDPNKTSVKYEADIAPVKVLPDIVLIGHAYSPANRQTNSLDTYLQVGAHKRTIRVTGDRFWQRNNLQWQPTHPQLFDRIPLIYENAFGGGAPLYDGQEIPEFCVRNPIGKGFTGSQGQGLKEGLPLPNLETPSSLIQNWSDSPAPAGFGFIGRNWQPRIAYAGTYDQNWQQKRMPLLPIDFDEKYYNGAHPDFQLATPLGGGEEITAINVTESGRLKFNLPNYSFTATALIKGKTSVHLPKMDTVLIEPDQMRVQITWRVAIPCARQFLYIDKITVDWRQV